MNSTIIMVSLCPLKTYIGCFHQYYLVASTVDKLHFPVTMEEKPKVSVVATMLWLKLMEIRTSHHKIIIRFLQFP